jgi:hypothetical protein
LLLHLKLENYEYVGWFTVFDLDTYNIILGKRWFQDMNLKHTIDNEQNILWISEVKGKDPGVGSAHVLYGLRPWEGRDGKESLAATINQYQLDIVWQGGLGSENELQAEDNEEGGVCVCTVWSTWGDVGSLGPRMPVVEEDCVMRVRIFGPF